MKLSTSAAFLYSSVSLAIITGTVVGNHETQQRIKIIQLGDSYSAGNGFDVNNPNDGWHGPKWCFRNRNTWGEQAVEIVRQATGLIGNVVIDYSNHACSGSHIEHITTSYTTTNECSDYAGDIQYSSKPVFSFPKGFTCQHTMRPQIENVQQNVDIVLMTAGGNDAGFVEIMKSCFVSWLPGFSKQYASCEEGINHGMKYVEEQYEAELIDVLESITERMKPGSKVVFNPYPHLATEKDKHDHQLLRQIVEASINETRKAIQHVNYKLKRNGSGVEVVMFMGHVDAFAGHEAETSSMATNPDGWLVEISGISGLDDAAFVSNLYHPNPLGHNGWANALSVKLESVIREIVMAGKQSTYLRSEGGGVSNDDVSSRRNVQEVLELIDKPIQMALLVDMSMLDEVKDTYLPVFLNELSSISSDYQVSIVTFGCHEDGSTLIANGFTRVHEVLTESLNLLDDENIGVDCQTELFTGLWTTLMSEKLAWYDDAKKSVWVMTNRQPLLDTSTDEYVEPRFNRHDEDIIKESQRLNAELNFIWAGSGGEQPAVFHNLCHGTRGEVLSPSMHDIEREVKKEINAPFARIQPTSIGVVGKAATFDARASYDPHGKSIVAFHWDFGDGTTAKTKVGLVEHVFESTFAGYIRVDVKTHDGRISHAWQRITVNKEGTSLIDMCDPDNQVAMQELGIEVHGGDPITLSLNGYEYPCNLGKGDGVNVAKGGDEGDHGKPKKGVKKNQKKRKNGLRN